MKKNNKKISQKKKFKKRKKNQTNKDVIMGLQENVLIVLLLIPVKIKLNKG